MLGVYDGAADKAKVKGQFEHMLNKIVEEMKIAEKNMRARRVRHRTVNPDS